MHDKIKDHICEICGYATSRKNNLKQHKRSFHKMEEKGFKCNHCHYATYRMCDLRRHMSVHNRTRPREVRCEYCSCTFSEKTNLKKHKEKFHKKYDKTQVEDDIDIVKDEPFSLEWCSTVLNCLINPAVSNLTQYGLIRAVLFCIGALSGRWSDDRS